MERMIMTRNQGRTNRRRERTGEWETESIGPTQSLLHDVHQAHHSQRVAAALGERVLVGGGFRSCRQMRSVTGLRIDNKTRAEERDA
jgi:hypothetical protein